MLSIKNHEWNKSYKNKDNYIFYPNEEIIRFISKYIRKRIGLNQFKDIQNCNTLPKVLDFGCGIGRHVFLLNEFSLDAYGFDFSDEAIKVAKSNCEKLKLAHLVEKFIVADISDLPYEDKQFDFMLSHGVVDSIPFNVAKKGMEELYRTLNDDGLIYLDLISTDDFSYGGSSLLEKTVTTEHEKNTVQSYFNDEKINTLIQGKFTIVEKHKIIKQNCLDNTENVRYHIILKKMS